MPGENEQQQKCNPHPPIFVIKKIVLGSDDVRVTSCKHTNEKCRQASIQFASSLPLTPAGDLRYSGRKRMCHTFLFS